MQAEDGIWVEYEGLRAWCSSHHLVPDKEAQLRRLWAARAADIPGTQINGLREAPRG